MDDDISKKINILNELNNEIEECDEFLSRLIESDKEELEYSKLLDIIPPKERIDLNWDLSYIIYTFYYSNIT